MALSMQNIPSSFSASSLTDNSVQVVVVPFSLFAVRRQYLDEGQGAAIRHNRRNVPVDVNKHMPSLYQTASPSSTPQTAMLSCESYSGSGPRGWPSYAWCYPYVIAHSDDVIQIIVIKGSAVSIAVAQPCEQETFLPILYADLASACPPALALCFSPKSPQAICLGRRIR